MKQSEKNNKQKGPLYRLPGSVQRSSDETVNWFICELDDLYVNPLEFLYVILIDLWNWFIFVELVYLIICEI